MEMLDCGVVGELMKPGVVDGPGNAITLTLEMRQRFAQFHVCFSEVAAPPRTTWRVDVLVPVLGGRFPVTTRRTWGTGVEPPGGRLLALHAAVGRVLHGSGAGEYLRVLLRDAEGGGWGGGEGGWVDGVGGVGADGGADEGVRMGYVGQCLVLLMGMLIS